MSDRSFQLPQALRVALVFAVLVAGFGALSALTGWPDAEGWPLALLLALALAALPLAGPALTFLRDSRATLDIRGVKLDFSAATVPPAEAPRVNLQDDPGVGVNDTDAASLAQAAEAASGRAHLVLDLGTGRSWYATRLFVLAAAAAELAGAQALVLVAQRGAVPGRFVGWIRPADAVTAFCREDPRYRHALLHARAVLAQLRAGGGYGEVMPPGQPLSLHDDVPALRYAYAERGDLAFVPALVKRLQEGLPDAPVGAGPLPEPLEPAGDPPWLEAEAAERLLGPWLVRETLSDGADPAAQRRALADTPHRLLAACTATGVYRGLIDVEAATRQLLLSQVERPG
jgi:hypothetical protein